MTREAVLERMHPEDRISWNRTLENRSAKSWTPEPVQDRAARRQRQAYSHDPASGRE